MGKEDVKMDEKEENKNSTIITIVCVILFFVFIFLSSLFRDDNDSAFMRACAGFAAGFWVARMYASYLIVKTREQVKSDYSFYENMYNYHLKNKLKPYIIKWQAKENGKILLSDEYAMDKEEAIFKFNASNENFFKDVKIVEITEGEITAEILKEHGYYSESK